MKLSRICLGVKVGFEAFSEGGERGGRTNLLRKSIPNSGSTEGKTMTKLIAFTETMNVADANKVYF